MKRQSKNKNKLRNIDLHSFTHSQLEAVRLYVQALTEDIFFIESLVLAQFIIVCVIGFLFIIGVLP